MKKRVLSLDYETYAHKAPLSPAQQAFYVFYRKTGVCEGYAQLTNLMNIIAGLPTAYIDGKARNMAHSWNAVYADGRWIYYDATWNDWDVDPCFYHDSIKGINIYGEIFLWHSRRCPRSKYFKPEGLQAS